MGSVPPLPRVLLLTSYFPPDTGSAAHLFHEFGKALVERGYRVTVLTGFPGYHAQGPLDCYRGRAWMREQIDGIDVVRVWAPRVKRDHPLGRALWQLSLAAVLSAAGMLAARHEVAVAYSPPLPFGLTAWFLRSIYGMPFILNVQDLFPQSVIDLGMLTNPRMIRAAEGLERFLYRRANAIVVHSEGNRRHVIEKGAQPERVSVIPNWTDTEFIRPGERMNGFRLEHNMGDVFIVSFAGILGHSQDLDVVLEAAQLTSEGPRPTEAPMLWLIVGDGVARSRIQEKARAMGLDHVRFLPMQSRATYPSVLAASDVCLATLHRRVRTPVVPSKILSIMAAGRPVVAALNLDGDAPRLVAEAQCGLCVPAGDARALADAVLRLHRDEALRAELGHNGRRYAEQHLSVSVCAAQYEAVFRRVKRR